MDVYRLVFFLTNVLAWTKAQPNCSIPTGDQFARTRYGPAISAQARQFPASAIDGNGYFRAGANVPNNFRIRLHCLKDQYGDSIHKVYSSTCRDGAWSPELPSCLDHAKCGRFPNVRDGIPSERRSSIETYLHGHVITFRCSGNRQLIGRNTIHCDDGKWSTPRFRCVEQTDTMRSCTLDNITCTSSDGSDGCLQGQLVCNGTCVATRWACERGSYDCIKKSYVCDDEWDCPDGSDERNCNATTTTARPAPTLKPNGTTETKEGQRSDVHTTTGAMKPGSSSEANKPATVGPQPTTRMSTGKPFTLPNSDDKFGDIDIGIEPISVTRQVESATVQSDIVSAPYPTPLIAGVIGAVGVACLIIICLVCLVACLIVKRRLSNAPRRPLPEAKPREETEMGIILRVPLAQYPENIYEEIDRRQSRDNVYSHEQETVPVENTYLELGDVSPDTHLIDRTSGAPSSSYGDATAFTSLVETDTDEQSGTWREHVGSRGSSYASAITFAKGYQGGQNKQPLSESSGYGSDAESGETETRLREDTGNIYERHLKPPSLFDDSFHVYGTIDNSNAPHDMCLDYEVPVSRRDNSQINEDSTRTGDSMAPDGVVEVTTNSFDGDYLHPVNAGEARTGSVENDYLHPT